MQLLEDAPYETISITDIVKRAGVSRSTFYRYYQDKDDIFRKHYEYLNELFAVLLQKQPNLDVDRFLQLEFIFHREQSRYFKLLAKAHRDYILFDYISDISRYSEYSDEERSVVRYQSISLFSIIYTWVIHDGDDKPSDMAAMVIDNMRYDKLEEVVSIFSRLHQKLL